MNHLLRPVKLDIAASGHVMYREPGTELQPGWIPFFSTETVEEAKAMINHFCRKARPPGVGWIVNVPPSYPDELEALALEFEEGYPL